MAKIIKVNPALILDEITKLFPDARCELNYQTDLQLLIAIMLSAQTTDVSVNNVTPDLFTKFPTLEALKDAPIEDIEMTLHHLGLYKNKSKNLKAMAIKLSTEFQGIIPADQLGLESLPGVGRKTANVFLSEWHKIPRIAVDTHVHRVSVRLGMADEFDNPEKVEKKLMKLYPEHQWIELHHKLIFFGRYFCRAVNPDCTHCPLLSVCKKPSIK